MGFATHTEIAAFWDHISPAEARAWCADALAAGILEQVQITAADGTAKPAFARPGLAQDAALDQAPTSRLRVLSPFDPALRDRNRAERLFGFSYRIEMFVPEVKRTFGYYVFPILQGDRIVGRVDMKAFRNQDVLRVKALWPEGKTAWGKGRQQAFEGELVKLCTLAGVSKIAFDDGWLRPPAQTFL